MWSQHRQGGASALPPSSPAEEGQELGCEDGDARYRQLRCDERDSEQALGEAGTCPGGHQ